jgi:hypothetical protein
MTAPAETFLVLPELGVEEFNRMVAIIHTDWIMQPPKPCGHPGLNMHESMSTLGQD